MLGATLDCMVHRPVLPVKSKAPIFAPTAAVETSITGYWRCVLLRPKAKVRRPRSPPFLALPSFPPLPRTLAVLCSIIIQRAARRDALTPRLPRPQGLLLFPPPPPARPRSGSTAPPSRCSRAAAATLDMASKAEDKALVAGGDGGAGGGVSLGKGAWDCDTNSGAVGCTDC